MAIERVAFAKEILKIAFSNRKEIGFAKNISDVIYTYLNVKKM